MKFIISDKEEALSLIKEIVAENYQVHVNDWNRIKDKEPKKELLKAMDNIFRSTAQAQMEKGKKEIAFINIHYLRASLLDGSFGLMINTYSEDYYFDNIDCSIEWIPYEIRKYFEEDMKNLEQSIRRKNIIISQKELFDIRKKHYFDYLILVAAFLIQCMDDIVALESFHKMSKKEKLYIQYGEIYGHIMPIYESR